MKIIKDSKSFVNDFIQLQTVQFENLWAVQIMWNESFFNDCVTISTLARLSAELSAESFNTIVQFLNICYYLDSNENYILLLRISKRCDTQNKTSPLKIQQGWCGIFIIIAFKMIDCISKLFSTFGINCAYNDDSGELWNENSGKLWNKDATIRLGAGLRLCFAS